MVIAEEKLPVCIGEVIDGKYRIDRVLGAGGMGIVVAATHLQLEQAVALKFVLPQVAEMDTFRERFMREARASSRLKSEHVARVYDVGTTESGIPYLVMELLQGSDLASLVQRQQQEGRTLPVPEAIEYVVQACEAIVEAHQLGIVHRDLKPANLFVTRRPNGAPLVKVLDFGISKWVGPNAMNAAALTQSTAVLGSPLYMAPEQLRSARAVDARSDIWALGIIVYELLTGRVPFHGETLTELCLRVVSDPAPPPSEARNDLPAALIAIMMRCLEKDPTKRFPTVAALAAALEPFSASAGRGVAERGWRSLSETADQRDVSVHTALSPVHAGSGATENSTWGGTRPMQGTRTGATTGKKRMFAAGLLAGGALIAIVSAAGFFTRRGAIVSAADSAPSAVAPAGSAYAESRESPDAGAAAVEKTASSESSPAPSAAESARAPKPTGRPPRRAPSVAASSGSGSGSAAASAQSPSASTIPAETPRTSTNGAPILH